MAADELPELVMDDRDTVTVGKFAGTAHFPSIEPWFVRFVAQAVRGQLAIVSLAIDVDFAKLSRDEVTDEPEHPAHGITAKTLSAVKLGAILRALRIWLLETESEFLFDPESIDGQVERRFAEDGRARGTRASRRLEQLRLAAAEAVATTPDIETDSAPRTGRPVVRDDAFLREVAELRLILQALGRRGATAAIAQHFAFTNSTAETYLAKANRSGWLEPGAIGQPVQTREPSEKLINTWAEEGVTIQALVRDFLAREAIEEEETK